MQRALQACWLGSIAHGRAQLFAAIYQQQQQALFFSTAPKQTILNKSKKNIRKSGKQLGEKAEEVLEKVVSLGENAPPEPPQKPPPQRKK
ncbi:hypothetical protein Ndes2437A_g04257 [Nannochloris sp. 'desiccata']